MSDNPWVDVLNRISTSEPIDLDALIFDEDGAGKPETDPAAFPDPGAFFPAPCLLLWHLDRDSGARLGVRVDKPLTDTTRAASRLAAAALEKGISPVILSTLPDSGFARFGFRVERVIGGTAEERAACEDQIKSFWNIAIVIDAADIVSLR